MSELVILRGRLLADPNIATRTVKTEDGNSKSEIVVTIEVELDSFSANEKPQKRQFTYTEKAVLDAQNNMKSVADSLATQMMFSKKGHKVFIQVNKNDDGSFDDTIYSYYDQLTQNGRK